MTVVPLASPGNSSKFTVTTEKGSFILTMSHTLRAKIWELSDAEEELEVARDLAEAVIAHHKPKLPFRKLYIFAEHNTQPRIDLTIQRVRSNGLPESKREK